MIDNKGGREMIGSTEMGNCSLTKLKVDQISA